MSDKKKEIECVCKKRGRFYWIREFAWEEFERERDDKSFLLENNQEILLEDQKLLGI